MPVLVRDGDTLRQPLQDRRELLDRLHAILPLCGEHQYHHDAAQQQDRTQGDQPHPDQPVADDHLAEYLQAPHSVRHARHLLPTRRETDEARMIFSIRRYLMGKLRDAFGKARRRPVSDGLWEYLEAEGRVADAESMDTVKEGVEYLRNFLGAHQTAVDSDRGTTVVLDGPRDASTRARIDALSEIFAAWAEHDPDIDAFRRRALTRRDADGLRAWAAGGPHPGYRLLAEDEVSPWVLERHNAAAPTGNGDTYIPELLLQQCRLVPEIEAFLLQSQLEPEIMELLRQSRITLESRIIHLQYVDHDQLRTVTVVKRSTLGDLAELSEKLGDRYSWHPAWAANYVLTGDRPIVSTYSVSAQVSYGMGSAPTTRVTLTLDPFLPPQQVADLYADLRSRLQPQPPRRAQSLRSYRLAAHVGPHVIRYPANPAQVKRRGRPHNTPPGGFAYYTDPVGCTWQDLRRSWNDRYPTIGEDGKSWRYDRSASFINHSKEALDRLLDPSWGLETLRQQGRLGREAKSNSTEPD